ncbi:polyprenyl synthetase family protein [Marinilabiliaceae bacterium JC017]|nr:polyprenyl synthetase family protein [Marinilabiliaceae bacterium JC017]
MYIIKDLQEMVQRKLNLLELVKEPVGLYEPIDYVLSIGGKRIRPALCLAACQLFQENNLEQAMYPALGLEIFHNFTLLHDDVMDNASVRRNKPTVHMKWNANTAILSGDAMMIKATQFIAMCPNEVLKSVLDVFNQIALEVCEGQQLDMEFEERDDVSVEEYMNMIRLKTAVLLAGSLKVGAIIGGASSEQADLLYEFGENIGVAFQLQDDFLDVYGDEKSFGKSIGGDIINNKKTFLLINALKEATGSLKTELQKWICVKEFDPAEKIKTVTAIYNDLKLPEQSKKEMSGYFDKAISALNKIEGNKEIKEDLKRFAHKLIERSR